MIMTNKLILKAIKDQRMKIDNFSKSCLFQTSYNIRIAKVLLSFRGKAVSVDLEKKKQINLEPKNYVICRSLERIKLDNSINVILGGKSDLINKGLLIINGVTIDPSFEGYLEFGIFNASEKIIKLKYKDKFLKAVFFDISDVLYEQDWLPKKEQDKWKLRNIDAFALKKMSSIFYQSG